MSTYIGNCYELVAEVRRAIREYSTAKLQGTDTSGAFLNEQIIKAINDAQKYLFDILFTRMPFLFLTSASLVGSNSIYTLPSDFFKLRRFETADKVKIKLISVDDQRLSDSQGSKYIYRRQGNTLIVDMQSLSDTCTIYYYKRPRNITMDKVQTGGALSMTLATTARKESDYYKNMTIEDITGDFTDTISAYSSARVATIAQTAGTADYYGIVSELPEQFHHLIGQRAALKMRVMPQSVTPPTPMELGLFKEDLVESIRSYAGTVDTGDQDIHDVILDLDPLVH